MTEEVLDPLVVYALRDAQDDIHRLSNQMNSLDSAFVTLKEEISFVTGKMMEINNRLVKLAKVIEDAEVGKV